MQKGKDIMQLISNAKSVNDVANVLANDVPALGELNQEQLQHIAEIVYKQRLANDLNKKVELSKIDYVSEKTSFIKNAGRNDSQYTKIAYTASMKLLEDLTAKKHLSILEINPRDADDIITMAKDNGGSPATIRRHIAAWSAFFSFLERRHDFVKNPFRGTKRRPKQYSVKDVVIPTPDEVQTFIDNSDGITKQAIAVMAYRGLRVGGLPNLSIHGNRFKAFSKGKIHTGELPQNVLSIINCKKPFDKLTQGAIRLKIERLSQKLLSKKQISHKYSCHDFRHFYAVTQYTKDKDILRVSKLLAHSNISITQAYLKSINVTD